MWCPRDVASLGRIVPIVFAATAATTFAAPRTAEACGGTFCDGGPMNATVDQAAETVLFVQDGAYIEAHVQIVIDPNTDASKFAWVLPMPSTPDVSVGS